MTQSEQTERLRIFFSGETFLQMVPKIVATHHPLVLRTPDQHPWQISRDEAEQILREFAPELSLTISGATMVVFAEQKEPNC